MKIKQNPIIYLTSILWKHANGRKKQVILVFILYFFSNVFSMSHPLFIAWFMNYVQLNGITQQNFSTVCFFLSGLIVFELVFWIFHYPSRIIEQKNAFFIRLNYKKYLLNGTLNLPLKWHSDNHSGDTIDKIEKGSGALGEFSSDLFSLMEILMTFVVSFFVLAYFDLHSIFFVAFLVVLIALLSIKFDKILKKYYRKLRKADNEVSAKVYDSIGNITTVVILRIEKMVENSIIKKMLQPFPIYRKKIFKNEKKWFLVSILTATFTFFILVSYIYFEVKANAVIMVGSLFALYGYLDSVTKQSFNLAWRYSDLVWKKSAVQNSEELAKNFKEKKKVHQVDLNTDWNELEIKNLNFSYDEKGKKKHLQNISLKIKKGQKIAFIGESGSGKTTMLKIIRELYKPSKLNLYLDGSKLEYGFGNLSESISLIPQEPEIFNTTVKENITMGIFCNFKKIKKYTDMAMFSNVVLRLPKKLNSNVQEKGVNLSGGEKQRLALSRGLLASEDKEMILLDEPTSSVDFRNEMKIYENIFNEFFDKTIISSIHRLHMLPMFDMIYFFKNGKLIAEGSFDLLLKKSKEFQEIWEKQKRKSLILTEQTQELIKD